ncbi:MAG: hypothetical protein K6B13_08955 [Prevotella sp.]|nr:hypothetical protein [Prevotella sp.]
MTILEQALVPKNPAKRSEDGIVVTPDFIAVIDGSTSKSRRRCHRDYSLRKHSNGELAMLTLAAYIKKMPKDISCHQFCLGATQAVRRRYVKSLLPHLAEHPEDRLTASVIVFSRLRRELWMVGDCQALLIGTPPSSPDAGKPLPPQFFDNPKPYEQELAQRRADLIRAGSTADAAREAIIPRMLETMQHQNNGYSVVDGFAVDERHVRVIPLDFQPWHIILASDGYPFLCPTLAESEARLAEQREKDPVNIGPDFMATKAFIPGNNSFDDRAYISFIA